MSVIKIKRHVNVKKLMFSNIYILCFYYFLLCVFIVNGVTASCREGDNQDNCSPICYNNSAGERECRLKIGVLLPKSNKTDANLISVSLII